MQALHLKNIKPSFSKFRSLSLYKRELVDDILNDMENQKIIQKVENSEWAAPIVCVIKKSRKIRIWVDFSTGLNENIIFDYHPIPKIEEFLYKLKGG